MTGSLVTRFAPSPTGFLHRGHAASALLAWHLAREAGGRFLLRIEDIDWQRRRPEFCAAILEDLAWLGLDWDGGVRVQSSHLSAYGASLGRLNSMGLLYPCFCSRAEIAAALGAPHGVDLPYPGTCRHLAPGEAERRMADGESYALRLDITAAVRRAGTLRWYEEEEGWLTAEPERFGDVVLARKDVPASYHLCVTHDDALQGVTLVTRGVDLKPLTDLHVLLQALLGWPTPEYRHHALLKDAAGRRLAKRDGAESLRALRAAGAEPAILRADLLDHLLPDRSSMITLQS